MAESKEIQIISFINAEKWRRWLSQNHVTSHGIFLRIFKKASDKPTVTYAEALDEALCYGWIDGIRKSFDEISFLQKFTPRQKRSIWSKRNQEHVDRLINEGRMQPPGHAEIERAKNDGRWERAYDSPKNMEVPQDFLRELRKDKSAFDHFQTLTKANKFAVAFRLHNAKRPETREKRMRDFLDRLARGEKII